MNLILTKKTKIIILFIIVISYVFLCMNMAKNIKEAWVNYKQLNHGNILTGSEPLTFYRRDEYRMPYKYPARHKINYPIPHYHSFI